MREPDVSEKLTATAQKRPVVCLAVKWQWQWQSVSVGTLIGSASDVPACLCPTFYTNHAELGGASFQWSCLPCDERNFRQLLHADGRGEYSSYIGVSCVLYYATPACIWT